jgi:hypothetical protein
MSFDLFLRCVQTGEPWGLQKAELRSLFPVVDAASEPDYWLIAYDDRNRCRLAVSPLPGDSSSTADIHVERPCGDLRLWKALLRILQMGPVVMYFPGGPPIVGSAETMAVFSKSDMVSLGEPECVGSAEEIFFIIRRS